MMTNIVTCTILYTFVVCVTAVDKSVEYKRTGSCDFTQECVYKYISTQYNYAEEDREGAILSADVLWHCESSGSFGTQSASEFCFIISKASLEISAANNAVNHTSEMADALQGEFCYVQTSDGKIVSVHYGTTENDEAINIKRSIASTFQANFDRDKSDVEEADPGSVHTSHYSFDKESGDFKFTREVRTGDLIKLANDAPQNALIYDKVEESTFAGAILQESHGIMRIRINFGSDTHNETGHDMYNGDKGSTFNKNIDFSNQFQSNGTYSIEKISCQRRSKRDAVFPDLTASHIKRGSILAVINTVKLGQSRIRKIRDTITSVAELFERLYKNPNDPALVDLVSSFRELLALEAEHGTPPGHTPAIDLLIEYYKKIRLSNKPESVEMRKLIYSFLAADGSLRSQQVMGGLLTKGMGKDERDILLHQLAQISNAGPELVGTVININPSNDDDLLLVLGALARNNDHAIQTVVVDELLRRLDTVKSSTNNTDLIILLNYALGNTGSKLAINALLSSLDHDDIDTQVSVIRGLGVHLDQPEVQQAVMVLLNETEEDKVLEEALVIFKEALDNKILVSPNEDLLDTIVKIAVKLENPNLYELLIQYLTLVGTDGTQQYIETLKRQHNYGQVLRDHSSDSIRVRRGLDWDEYNSDYNIVASYYQRRQDVREYPSHLAYIWGTKIGIEKLNMRVGTGVFAGAKWSSSSKRLKFYSKTAIQVNVLGTTFNVLNLEYTNGIENYKMLKESFLKIGAIVFLDDDEEEDFSGCKGSGKLNLWNRGDQKIFDFTASTFVYISYLHFNVKGTLKPSAEVCICMSPLELRACVNVQPSITLVIEGAGTSTLSHTVRGGVDLKATLGYYVKPEVCFQGHLNFDKLFEACLNLYHGTPDNNISLVPWFQHRNPPPLIHTWSARFGWENGTQHWKLPSLSETKLVNLCENIGSYL